MKLYDYLKTLEDGEELEVTDNTYDCTFYFYNNINDTDNDDWTNALLDLSKLVDFEIDYTINLTEVVMNHIKELKEHDLFISYDVDDIMEDMENILAGNVSEYWLCKFVYALSE